MSEPRTQAGRDLLSLAHSFEWNDDWPGAGERRLVAAILAIEAEAATLDEEAVLEVAKLADDDAFLCDFGGRLSVNLPNLERVVPITREYRDGGAA